MGGIAPDDGLLARRSTFSQLRDPALDAWVDAFWSLEAAGETRRILPDGCMDFIFDLATGRGRVVGTMSSSQLVAVPAGTRFFGVRFAPGAAPALLEAPADSLCDHAAVLDEVSRAKHFCLGERIAEAVDAAARVRIVAEFLRAGPSRLRPVDLRVRRASTLLSQSHGALSIADVAKRVGVGERQLERLFRERVGVRPKLFARVLRMQRALQLLEGEARSEPEATRLARGARARRASRALDAGFADEPHLVRDFRELTGLTPQRLLAERRVGFVQAKAAPRG